MTIDMLSKQHNPSLIDGYGFTACRLAAGLLAIGLTIHHRTQAAADEPATASTTRQVTAAQAPVPDGNDGPTVAPQTTAVERMESVSQMLSSQMTDASVQDLQQKIVADLQSLLQQQKPSAERPQQRPQPMADPASESQPDTSPAPMPDGNDPRNAQPQDNQPQDSTNRTDPGNTAKAELQQRERLLQGIWGHLKPEFRREFLKLADERNLPQYDQQIQRYYQSLSEVFD